MKKCIFTFFACLVALTASARITMQGDLPILSKAHDEANDPFYLNDKVLDAMDNFSLEELAGLKQEHMNTFLVEYSSTYVHDGVKIGENTFLLSFQDRFEMFGGESYADFWAFMPCESNYAMQFAMDMGWKYALNETFIVDIGGNFTYATKRLDAAGIPGGGTTFFGDIYFGVIADIPLTPFAYYTYNFDYDAHKFKVGINPVFPLESVFGVENLSLATEIFYGYTTAGDWLNGYNNTSMTDSYSYVQAEAQFVYIYDGKWRFAIGGGYSYNNNARPSNKSFEPRQNCWIGTSVGFIF